MFKSQVRASVINGLLEKAAARNYGRYLPKLTVKRIRGFIDQPIAFDFPVTAIIGPNGGGKTTVLGAAACAYKDVSPRRFFAKSGTYDESMQDWSVEYEIVDRDLSARDTIRRTASFKNRRWNRQAQERKVLIFGVSRTVPANERTELLKCASSGFTVPIDKISELPETVRTAVSRILGRDVTGYRSMKIQDDGSIQLLTGVTSEGRGYSEFHFGAARSGTADIQGHAPAEQSLCAPQRIPPI
jgi:adenylate kinase family enzyme